MQTLLTFLLIFLEFGFAPTLATHTTSDGEYRMSPIEEILKESLRSNRVQACDGERITLSCPRNTQISIKTGFYGRVVAEKDLCPPQPHRKPAALSPDSLIHHSKCDVIQANTRISELCDKRRKCTLVVDSNTFEDDPCPTTSKYLQMAYGCMPMSFEEETFCSPKPSDPVKPEVRLECREGRLLAVYSAQMTTSARCTEDTDIEHECISDVLPEVLRQCHAKEGCSINTEDLKTNCKQGHLHIVYVCVNEEIFSEEAIKGELKSLEAYLKEADFMKKLDTDGDKVLKDIDDITQQVVDIAPVTDSSIHQIANDAGYVTHDEYRMDQPESVESRESEEDGEEDEMEPNMAGFAEDVIQIIKFFKENKEKTVICIGLALCMAAIVILSACIVSRLCCTSPKDSPKSRSSSRSRRSFETSRLVSSNYGGTVSPHLMDIEDEQFLRFSMGSTSKPNSTYTSYDF